MIHLVSAHVFIAIAVHYSFVHFCRFIMVVSNSASWLKWFTGLLVVNLHCLSCSMVTTKIFVDFHSIKWKPLIGHSTNRTSIASQTLVLNTIIWFHNITQYKTWIQSRILTFPTFFKAVINYSSSPIVFSLNCRFCKAGSFDTIIIK